MPTAPVYKQQIPVNQDVRPVLDDIRVDPNTYGAGFGAGLASAGTDLGHVAAILKHEEEKVKASIDYEQDAFIAAERQRQLSKAESLKPSEWAKNPNTFQEAFKAKIAERSKVIQDPVHRAEFDQRHSVTYAGFDREINSMYSKGVDEVDANNIAASKDLHSQNYLAAVSKGDPEAQGKSLKAFNDASTADLNRKRVAPDSPEGQATKGKETSDLLASGADSLIDQQRYEEAENYLAEKGGAITQERKNVLGLKLRSHRIDTHVERESNALIITHSTPENNAKLSVGDDSEAIKTAQEFLKNSKDPNKERIAAAFATRIGLNKSVLMQKQSEAEDALVIKLTGGVDGNLPKRPPNELEHFWISTLPLDRRYHITARLNNTEGLLIEDPNVIGTSFSMQQLAKTTEDVQAYKDYLFKNKAEIKSETFVNLSSLIHETEKRLAKDPEQQSKDDTFRHAFDSFARASGEKDPYAYGKSAEGQKTAYNLKLAFDKEYASADGKKRQGYDWAEEVGSRFAIKQPTTVKGVFGSSQKQMTTLDLINNPDAMATEAKEWGGLTPDDPRYSVLTEATLRKASENQPRYVIQSYLFGLTNNRDVINKFYADKEAQGITSERDIARAFIQERASNHSKQVLSVADQNVADENADNAAIRPINMAMFRYLGYVNGPDIYTPPKSTKAKDRKVQVESGLSKLDNLLNSD